MSLSPIVIQRYYDTRQNRFVSPGLSMARCTNWGAITIGSLIAVQIHACKGKNFELDYATGNVPTANQDTTFFTNFTGDPIFAVKTRTQWLAGDDSFAASISGGYYAALTTLASGRAAVCGIITDDTTPDEDYMAQMQFLDASGNPAAIPPVALPIAIPNPITTGDEGDAPNPTRYSGVVTIPATIGYLDIAIAGLTVATGSVAALTQQDNGYGLTSFLPTISANSLRITAANTENDWEVYYQLGSL